MQQLLLKTGLISFAFSRAAQAQARALGSAQGFTGWVQQNLSCLRQLWRGGRTCAAASTTHSSGSHISSSGSSRAIEAALQEVQGAGRTGHCPISSTGIRWQPPRGAPRCSCCQQGWGIRSGRSCSGCGCWRNAAAAQLLVCLAQLLKLYCIMSSLWMAQCTHCCSAHDQFYMDINMAGPSGQGSNQKQCCVAKAHGAKPVMALCDSADDNYCLGLNQSQKRSEVGRQPSML